MTSLPWVVQLIPTRDASPFSDQVFFVRPHFLPFIGNATVEGNLLAASPAIHHAEFDPGAVLVLANEMCVQIFRLAAEGDVVR